MVLLYESSEAISLSIIRLLCPRHMRAQRFVHRSSLLRFEVKSRDAPAARLYGSILVLIRSF